MRLHDYAASANCLKVRLLAARLELELERVEVDIFGPHGLAAINPAARTPVLELEHGCSIPESGAILLFLAEGTPWLPDDPIRRAQVTAWLLFEQNLIEANVGTARFWTLTGREADRPDALDQRREAGAGALALLDRHLAGRPYVHGESETVANLALFGYAHIAHEAGIDVTPFVHLRRWLERVESHPRHVDDLAPYPARATTGERAA